MSRRVGSCPWLMEQCGKKPCVSTGATALLQVGGLLPVSYYSNAVFKASPKKWGARQREHSVGRKTLDLLSVLHPPVKSGTGNFTPAIKSNPSRSISPPGATDLGQNISEYVMGGEGACPVQCRMFSSISSLYLLNAVTIPLHSSYDSQNVSRHWPLSHWRQIVPSWEPLV